MLQKSVLINIHKVMMHKFICTYMLRQQNKLYFLQTQINNVTHTFSHFKTFVMRQIESLVVAT